MPRWLVIGISGVTCGGKTTLSHNLCDFFKSKQNAQLWQSPYTVDDVQLISQDDYFLPVDDRRHEWIEKLNTINFELLTSLDMKQMISDITWTMKGRYLVGEPMENSKTYLNEVSMTTNLAQCSPSQLMPPPSTRPITRFHNHKVQQQQQRQQQLHEQQMQHYKSTGHYDVREQYYHMHPRTHPQYTIRSEPSTLSYDSVMNYRDHKVNILIIEGFMIFNQSELLELCNIKFHFHLPYEKCFERRQRRTYEPPDVTGYFEMCVWPHYERNFAQYRDRKDITFLNGEISQHQICDFALQKIRKFVEERCDVVMAPVKSAGSMTPFHALPPPNMIGIHNGNNYTAKPCPMEQQ